MSKILTSSSSQRLLLTDVDWRSYLHMLRAFQGQPSVRLTYDRGSLEIMIMTYEHEGQSHLLGRFLVALTEELGKPVAGGGSTTFKRRDRKRGLEADECFWIAGEPRIRGKKRIDLRIDPPPDLAIEVDVTRRSLQRMPIYAALRVPEVWRLAGGTLTFHVLGADGKFAAALQSASFPGLEPSALTPFLALRGQVEENALVRQFRDWVRQQVAAGVLQ